MLLSSIIRYEQKIRKIHQSYQEIHKNAELKDYA